MPRLGLFLMLASLLVVRAFAANAPAALADVIYHEHYRALYDPGEEDIALRADGSSFSYLKFIPTRFAVPYPPGGEGSFTYAKTGAASAEISITDQAGNKRTRTLTFVTDTSGTWSTPESPGGQAVGDGRTVEQTFSLRPLYPGFPLMNSSSRTTVAPDRRSIFGFVVTGETRWVLVRVIGPGLQQFGVGPVASAPVLEIFDSTHRFAVNSGWDADPADDIPLAPVFRLVGAFPLATGSKDAAVMYKLGPGAYTVQASSAGTAGEVLTEIYVLP